MGFHIPLNFCEEVQAYKNRDLEHHGMLGIAQVEDLLRRIRLGFKGSNSAAPFLICLAAWGQIFGEVFPGCRLIPNSPTAEVLCA